MNCEICGRPSDRQDKRRPKPVERRHCRRCEKALERYGRASPEVKLTAERVALAMTPYERALEAWREHLDASAEDDDEYHRTRVQALRMSRLWSLTGEPCGGCARGAAATTALRVAA